MEKAEDSVYHKRRRHILDIIRNIEPSLYQICKWAGRWDKDPETNAANDTVYHYTWQVISGKYDHKTSKAVLDDIEQVLRDNDFWVERK